MSLPEFKWNTSLEAADEDIILLNNLFITVMIVFNLPKQEMRFVVNYT